MIHSVCASPLRRQAMFSSAFVVLLSLSSAASALELDFNVANGNFTTTGNWVDADTGAAAPSAPTVDDTAYIRNAGTATISSSVAVKQIRVGARKTIGTAPNTTEVGGTGTLLWTDGEITGFVAGLHNGGPDIRVGRYVNANPNATPPLLAADYGGTMTQNGANTKLWLSTQTSKLSIGDDGSTPTPTSSYTLANGTIGTAIGDEAGFFTGTNNNDGINVRNGSFTMTGGQIVDATPDDLKSGSIKAQRFITVASGNGTLGSETYGSATFSGGVVDSWGGIRVAPGQNSRGYLNINGPVVITTGGDTSIGYNANNGVGEMNMSAGTFNVGRTVIDVDPNSGLPRDTALLGRFQVGHNGRGTLNMSGGTINVSREVRVGATFGAGGSIINQTGGTINTLAMSMGVTNDNPLAGGYLGATILIDGPNASFTQSGSSGGSIIGYQGKATFEVRQGTARLAGDGADIQLGRNVTSEAIINVKGGKLSLGGPLRRANLSSVTPVIKLTGGTLEFNNTATTAAHQVQVDITNEGSKLVTKPNAQLQVAIGSQSPAYPANFSMTSGSWDLDLASNIVLGADWFNAQNGTASLTGGTLNINYLSGFTPNVNQVFRIMRGSLGTTLNAGAITITGAGAGGWMLQEVAINNPGFPLDEEIQLKYLGAPLGVSGDYNGNGIVDAADYVLWRKGGTLQNDPTPGNQPADYAYWRSRFGATSGAGAGAGLASAAVPEPTSIALLAFGLVGLFAANGTRRRASTN